MSYRDELEAARMRVAELEAALAERDARIAALAAAGTAEAVGERGRIQLRQLQAALADARQRARDARQAMGQLPDAPEELAEHARDARRRRGVLLAGVSIAVTLVTAVLRWLLRH